MINQSNIELEKAVLGAILLDKEAIYKVIDILKPDCFYFQENRLIIESILRLHLAKKPIDIITVSNDLKNLGVLELCGGYYYVSLLASNIGSAFHILEHYRELYDLYLKREFNTKLLENYKKIEENSGNDVFEVYNSLMNELSTLFDLKLSDDFYPMDEVINDRLRHVQSIDENSQIIGLKTGFSKLDKLTNGFQPADYIIIGARPSMGKTITALLVMRAAAIQSNANILFFSLEMSKERIADRLLSIETGLDSRDIAANRLNHNDWIGLEAANASRWIKKLFIIDKPGLTIEEIYNMSVVMKRKYNISEIIIDYIQLIKPSQKTGTTNDKTTHVSRNIKGLAKELNLPVIALSQLSRNDNREPRMSDLRDTGSLEQDADIVWLLYRPDYEGKECSPEDRKRIWNILGKNRNGEIGIFYTYRNDIWSYIGESEFTEMPKF